MNTPLALATLSGLSLALAVQEARTPRPEVWTDLDGDGRQDVLTIAHGGTLRAFRTAPDGRLEQLPASFGLEGLVSFQALAAGDFDGDGRTDLFLASSVGAHRLLRHAGTSFVDVTGASGLELGAVEDAAFIDHDGDGDLDLRLFGPGGALAVCANQGDGRFLGATPEPDRSGIGVEPNESERPAEALPGARADQGPAGGFGAGGSAATGGRAGGSGGAGGSALSGTGGISAILGPPAVLPCMDSISDQAGNGCVQVSTAPLAGHLLPLGDELFVSPLGLIGFNTQSPAADVHLEGGSVGTLLIDSYNLLQLGGTSELQLGVGSGDYDEGMKLRATKAGLDVFSRRRTGPGGSVSVDYGPHLTVLRDATTKVGVAETAPVSTLHVGGDETLDGVLRVRRPDTLQTVALDPNWLGNSGGGGAARVYLQATDGALGMVLDAENTLGSGSKVTMYGDGGTLRVELDAEDGGAALMRLYKADNTPGIVLDANVNGDARIITEVLEITGGADLVESFDTGEVTCEPGTVLAIDPDRPGELAPSCEAYDRRLAGIVSGAGGVQPGLHLGQTGVATGSTPVALTGRVYVRCCAENGPVRPGDMLTSSSQAGVAMRATDPERSFGAVIGKAMTALEGESGLVLVLVNLQ